MASVLNTLNIGYSGLNAAQVAINTVGHNISNAETDGYTRQRVMTQAATPLSLVNAQIGNGTEIQSIKRVFDNFVFDRYSKVSADKESSDYQKQVLQELSTYFPEINKVGIKADLSAYYNMWQTFSNNPSNDAIKVALAKQTEVLSKHLAQTQAQVTTLQSKVNDELAVNINQVNALASQLADLNRSINTAESGGANSSNDLRDKRNIIERTLSRLIGSTVQQGQITANMQVDSNSNTRTGSYTLNVNGFNIVDGNSYHPIKLTKTNNKLGFYDLSYERQDGVLIPMKNFSSGKVGAILALRGTSIDPVTGQTTDGVIQNVITQLDALSSGLIESTNNIYAASSVSNMQSNLVNITPTQSLTKSPLNIKQGSFNLVVYDLNGNIAAKREIKIDSATSMSGPSANSIEEQIKAQVDDNKDGNANNDVNSFMTFNFTPSSTGDLRLELGINSSKKSQGYKFGIEDKLTTTSFNSGSNFAGSIGLSRFFDGSKASDINLSKQFRDNPTLLSAGYSGVTGDNKLALDVIQQQFESYDFNVNKQIYNATIYGMFDSTSTYVGTETNAAITKNETISTQFNATKLQYDSVSKVSIDQEMANLIKYQTSYGAAAKVITTVDQMMQTLLGIKQ